MLWFVEAVLEDDSIDIAELNTGFLIGPAVDGDLGGCTFVGADSDRVKSRSHCYKKRHKTLAT